MPDVHDYDYVETLVAYLAMGTRCRNAGAVEDELLAAARNLAEDSTVGRSFLSHGTREPIAAYFDRFGFGLLEDTCPLSFLGAAPTGAAVTLDALSYIAPHLVSPRKDRIEAIAKLAVAHDDPVFLDAALGMALETSVETVDLFAAMMPLPTGRAISRRLAERLEADFDAQDAAWRKVVDTSVSAGFKQLPVALVKMSVPVPPLLGAGKAYRWSAVFGLSEGPHFSAHQRLAMRQLLPEIADILAKQRGDCLTDMRYAYEKMMQGTAEEAS